MTGRRSRLRKPTNTSANDTTRRSIRRRWASPDDSDIPDVFQDLLAEESATKAAGLDEDSKALKKRKTARHERQRHGSPSDVVIGRSSSIRILNPNPQSRAPDVDTSERDGRILQTITDSEESEDSDVEWEDALVDDAEAVDNDQTIEPEIGDLSITIGGKSEEKKPKKQVRRRGITSVDKKRRLEIHKMHFLCLLYHVHRRNAWCNDERVQVTLRKLPSPKTLANLVPNPEYTQFQASKCFMEGLKELRVLWTNRFTATAAGIHKPRWADADADVQLFAAFDELDDPMERQDFRNAATTLQGSQDVGAQLFCALLRSVGVETRLVCSLQCLPFASAAQASTPQKPDISKNTIVLDPYNTPQAPSPSKPKSSTPRLKRWSRLERAVGERSAVLNAGVAPRQSKKYHSPYPVYWVEAFNSAVQKWIPIDPLSTFTVDKPEKLEPPLNYTQNSLVYALAFEDDLTAKDVTRRYAKAYNAKTRKFRVECTDDGTKWLKRAMKPFKRAIALDRDQLEDAALARREGAEGIPKNVQDFKDHPVYVLERHLRHNEVIHPLHQVGKVNVGSAMNPKMEPIYRRKDVHVVKSADRWYRLGRDVKGGEQPLKHAKPKKGARGELTPSIDIDQQQEEIGAGLYAYFQTELYVPPPVVRGRVPRNAFGNLDLYVPSMVPKGGAHIRHKLAAKAARIIGVDYAEAVTGFNFKGRHGTAVVQGVVVASEYREAVEAVIDAMEYAHEEIESSHRSAEALRLWRRFYLGLRIAQRVNAIEIDGQTGPVLNVQDEIDKEDKALAEEQLAGGFFHGEGDATEPTFSQRHTDTFEGGFLNEGHNEGGFIVTDDDDDDEGGGFIRDESAAFGSSILAAQQLRPRHREGLSGGFMEEDGDGQGGGFIHDPSPALRSTEESGFVTTGGVVDDFEGGFMADGDNVVNSNRTLQKNTRREISPAEVEAEADLDILPDAEAPVASGDVVMSGAADGVPPRAASPSSSSPSEVGSLPLEDPEDEDAEPDWLLDVT